VEGLDGSTGEPVQGDALAGTEGDGPVCEHGMAMGYCPEGDCPHAEPF